MRRRALLSWKIPRKTEYLLLDDHATGDAGARIARGIALHVVRTRVDHQRGSTVAENRMGVVAHGNSGRNHGRLRRPIRSHREIRHVARVRTIRILQPMLLHVWVQVWTRGSERRTFALRRCVYVDPVIAGHKIHQVEANAHALRHR
jgi:hypothetical protein